MMNTYKVECLRGDGRREFWIVFARNQKEVRSHFYCEKIKKPRLIIYKLDPNISETSYISCESEDGD